MASIQRRLTGSALLGVFFLLSAFPLRADVDRTKKDNEEAKEAEKQARPELDGKVDHSDVDDEHEAFHKDLFEEGQKNLQEIQRLLDEVQNNLSKSNTGPDTRSKQRQAVERMNGLIKKLSASCKKCQGSGSGSSGKQPLTQQKSGQQQGQQQKKKEQPKGKDQQLPSQKQKEQGQREDNRDRLPNNQVAEDKEPDSGEADRGARMRQRSRWGFLPPKLRDDMISAADKEVPAEYQEIVDRYYKRLNGFGSDRRDR